MIGPLGGGALVQATSWRWIFAINVIPVLVTLWLLRQLPTDKTAPGHVDVVGAVLCALGLGGPVFALIEQPVHGWGDPLVFVPLIAGVGLFVAFLLWERSRPYPMLPLSLFRIRNFAVGNLTTLTLYAGLGFATFFLVLFIQQVGGYTPAQAGMSLLPITIVVFLLSKRFGILARPPRTAPLHERRPDRRRPRVAAARSRTGPSANYVTEILPGVLVFAFGLCGDRRAAHGDRARLGGAGALRPRQRCQQRGLAGRPDCSR